MRPQACRITGSRQAPSSRIFPTTGVARNADRRSRVSSRTRADERERNVKQTLEGRYPAKSDVVIKMMTDKKFYTDRLDLQGVSGYEVVDHKFDGRSEERRVGKECRSR